MTLLEELGYKGVTWRNLTLEQRRAYDKARYERRKDEINARRRELYAMKKEQKRIENN